MWPLSTLLPGDGSRRRKWWKSFDAETRALTGKPTADGEYSMTYTATDEDGDEAWFTFTIAVEAAPRAVRSSGVSGQPVAIGGAAPRAVRSSQDDASKGFQGSR